MNVWYSAAIAAAVLFVLIFPLPIRFQMYFSKAHKRLYYSILLFQRICLYSGYLRFHGARLMNTSFLGKSRFLSLSALTGKDGVQVKPSLFGFATFTKFNLYFEVGSTGDCAYPVLASGFLRAATGALLARMRSRNGVCGYNSYVVTKTDKDTFEASLDSVMKVSLLGVFYSVLKDFVRSKMNHRQKESASKC